MGSLATNSTLSFYKICSLVRSNLHPAKVVLSVNSKVPHWWLTLVKCTNRNVKCIKMTKIWPWLLLVNSQSACSINLYLWYCSSIITAVTTVTALTTMTALITMTALTTTSDLAYKCCTEETDNQLVTRVNIQQRPFTMTMVF